MNKDHIHGGHPETGAPGDESDIASAHAHIGDVSGLGLRFERIEQAFRTGEGGGLFHTPQGGIVDL